MIIEGLRLLEPLGDGSLGKSWAARDESTGALRVLRRIHPWVVEDPRDREILEDALHANRDLGHAGVLTHLEARLEGDQPWMTMERMSGGSLAARLAGGDGSTLTTPEAMRLGLDLLDALAAVHARGRAHGNLKPTNALFDADGACRLADTGLLLRTRSSGTSLSGPLLTTLAATAVEVLRGAPPHPGSDLFSLGLLLVEAMTGKHPNRRRPLPPSFRPRDLVSRLEGRPAAWIDLVLRLLEPDPARRPADAAAFAAELRALGDELEAATAPVVPVRQESGKTPAIGHVWPATLDQVLEELSLEARGVLGRGAMAWVMDAWDPRLERRVAVKIAVAGSEASKNALQRLLREARTGASVAHEALLPIYDAGWVGPHAYLVMPVVEGATLEQMLAISGPMTAAEVRAIGSKLAGALAHLHARNLLHRDIKPSNVLMDGEGRVYLGDLGLVRVLDETRFTVDGAFVGTPGYSAPEVLGGAEHSASSDQYQLGATLLMLLEGRRPLPDEVIRKLILRDPSVEAPVPSPDDEGPSTLHHRVVRVLRRACRFAPDERYESVEAFAQALRETEEAVRAASPRRTRPKAPARQPPRRRSSTVWMLAAAMAAAGAGLWLARAPDPGREPDVVTSVTPAPASPAGPDPALARRALQLEARILEHIDHGAAVQQTRGSGTMGTIFSELRDLQNVDEMAPILIGTVTDLIAWLEVLGEIPVTGEGWYAQQPLLGRALSSLLPALRTPRGKHILEPVLETLERRLAYEGDDRHRRIFSLDAASASRWMRRGDTPTRLARVRDLSLALDLLAGADAGWRMSPAGRYHRMRLLDSALTALEGPIARTLQESGLETRDARALDWRLELLELAESHEGKALAHHTDADWRVAEILILSRAVVLTSGLLRMPGVSDDVMERTRAFARKWKPALDVPLNEKNSELSAAWTRLGL